MKYLYLFLSIVTIFIIITICSTSATSHGGERIAIYNLSSTIRIMSRQLDRIEAKLGSCEQEKRK